MHCGGRPDQRLSLCGQVNSLFLNISKTKGLIVEQQRIYTALIINVTLVERVSSFKYHGYTHQQGLVLVTLTLQQQCRRRDSIFITVLHHLGYPEILLYSTVESILTYMTTAVLRRVKTCKWWWGLLYRSQNQHCSACRTFTTGTAGQYTSPWTLYTPAMDCSNGCIW